MLRTTNSLPFADWLLSATVMGCRQFTDIIQLEIYRYLLARTDRFGCVLDRDGNVDIAETNAAVHLQFMTRHLTERVASKTLMNLIPLIQPRLVLAKKKKASVEPLTFEEFGHFTSMVQLFELVFNRNILEKFGIDSSYVADFLKAHRNGSLFTESEDKWSLTATYRAVSIMNACGLDYDEFDPRLIPAILKALNSLQAPAGGFYNSSQEPIATVEATYSGLCLSQTFNDPKERISLKNKIPFASATADFIEKMQLSNGGYREDGLTPSATLKSTTHAVLSYGMLTDRKFKPLPKKKIIGYLSRLERDDSGAAADQWCLNSSLSSTLRGLIVRLFLNDELVMSRF